MELTKKQAHLRWARCQTKYRISARATFTVETPIRIRPGTSFGFAIWLEGESQVSYHVDAGNAARVSSSCQGDPDFSPSIIWSSEALETWPFHSARFATARSITSKWKGQDTPDDARCGSHKVEARRPSWRDCDYACFFHNPQTINLAKPSHYAYCIHHCAGHHGHGGQRCRSTNTFRGKSSRTTERVSLPTPSHKRPSCYT